LRGFDRAAKRMRSFLNARYGPVLARNLVTDARQEYARLIPELPDLQGRQPFTQFIITTGWSLAFYRALPQSRKPVREAGEFAYALTAAYVRSLPRVAARVIELVWFSKLLRKRLSRRAKQSQKHRQCGDFVYEYVEGETQRFDFGVDYLECAVLSFLKSQGTPELAPYICALDQVSSEALGWGLIRTTTLAEGGSRCDFRFKRGGETRIASTVLPMLEQ
jgi:hypothetical protein